MNPKLDKFLAENENITLMGIAWALYWRFFVIVWGGLMVLAFTIGFIGAL